MEGVRSPFGARLALKRFSKVSRDHTGNMPPLPGI
jgi:hypothetical protein